MYGMHVIAGNSYSATATLAIGANTPRCKIRAGTLCRSVRS